MIQGSYSVNQSPFAAPHSAFCCADLKLDQWRRPILPPAPASFSAVDAADADDDFTQSEPVEWLERNQYYVYGGLIAAALVSIIAFR